MAYVLVLPQPDRVKCLGHFRSGKPCTRYATVLRDRSGIGRQTFPFCKLHDPGDFHPVPAADKASAGNIHRELEQVVRDSNRELAQSRPKLTPRQWAKVVRQT